MRPLGWLAFALAGLFVAPFAQGQVTGHLGVGSFCEGYLAFGGTVPDGALCATHGLIVSDDSQEYWLGTGALKREFRLGDAGTLVLVFGMRDSTQAPGPGGLVGLPDVPNPDLRVNATLWAKSMDDLATVVDPDDVHADTPVAWGEAACPHMETVDVCEIPLETAGFVVPPTSRLDLQVITFEERLSPATLLVGGDPASRLEFPQGTLVEPSEADEPMAAAPTQESPASLVLLPLALLVALALRRRRA